MNARDGLGLLEIVVPAVLGLAVVLAGYRSKQPRRDLSLLAIPAGIWILVHLILTSSPTGSRVVNVVLILGPLIAAFIFLAKRWGAEPAGD